MRFNLIFGLRQVVAQGLSRADAMIAWSGPRQDVDAALGYATVGPACMAGFGAGGGR
jgi:hypothetical protein